LAGAKGVLRSVRDSDGSSLIQSHDYTLNQVEIHKPYYRLNEKGGRYL